MLKVAFILSLTICLAFAKHEQYTGHVLYEVKVSDGQQAQTVHALENVIGIDMWSYATPARPGLVLVAGSMRDYFQKQVTEAGATFKIEVENVVEMLEKEDELLSAAVALTNGTDGRLSFNVIHRYAAVDAYLTNLARQYSTVSVVSGGRSFEGRDIKYLRISTTNFQNNRKPVIVLQSLLHAREWVTLPAALYAIRKLVVDITDRDLVDNIDWIILPIANPDGYEFSHTNTRFWRKNRSTGHMIGNICLGVDLNRNFDYRWGTLSSNSPCSDTYHGKGPFSEPETVVLRNIIQGLRNRIELFIDIHSFGSMILYAYGTGDLPANALTLNVAGVRMAQAIDAVKWSSKPNYRVGNSALVLSYRDSGSANDYVQAVGVPLAYTYELPARANSGGLNGFLVDPAFIEQAGRETWEGIKAGARFVLQHSRSNKQ
ncbi:PREDICTED: carboxypeptidase B-like [Papilio xuthus]|uniref:Carboxypeptidase B-like n=1 Tax=Papilio xuthus TaxID=66420 RepID=A0AAJ6ZFM1_PAPXU|nr:PREDICTED: carboxypeptidase B-like [Papilio xuthus]